MAKARYSSAAANEEYVLDLPVTRSDVARFVHGRDCEFPVSQLPAGTTMVVRAVNRAASWITLAGVEPAYRRVVLKLTPAEFDRRFSIVPVVIPLRTIILNSKPVSVGQGFRLGADLTYAVFRTLRYRAAAAGITRDVPRGSEFKVTAIEGGAEAGITLQGSGPFAGAVLKLAYAEFVGLFLQSAKPEGKRFDVAGMEFSDKGIDFLYAIEARAGVSNHLHWPTGSSGVTLGAGYDMRERTEARVSADLVAVGVAKDVADKVAKGAGLTGKAAKKFCDDNQATIDLPVDKQKALLKRIIPGYEYYIKKYVTVKLLQNEYDALTSFCYNPGKSVVSVMKAINAGKIDLAMNDIKSRVYSDGKSLPGLVTRRDKEVKLYREAAY